MTLAFVEELPAGALAAPTDTTTARPGFLRMVHEYELEPPEQPDVAEAAATAAATTAAIIAQAKRLAERHPKSPAVFARLAHAEMHAGHRDDAVQAALRTVALEADCPDQSALSAAAVVLAAAGEHQLAEEALHRARGHGYSYLYAAFVAERGEYRTALARLEGQDDPASLMLRGWLLICISDYAGAVRTLRRVIAQDAPSADLLVNLGYAYGALGARRKALRATEMATYLAPTDRTAGFNLAGFRSASGDFDGALRELHRIEQFHPDDLNIPFAIAAVRTRCGDVERAARELAQLQSEPRAWHADPQDRAQLKANLASLEFSLGRRDRSSAITAIRRALEATNHQSLRIAELLATFYVKKSDASALQELYQALLGIYGHTKLYGLETRLAMLKAQFPAAVAASRRWVEHDPFNSDAAAFATYLTAEFSRDYDEAVRIGVEALRRVPDAEMVANNVACALAMAGRPREARRFLPRGRKLPHIVATTALIELVSGDVEAGRRGYEEAAVLAEERGERDFAALVRFRAKLAMMQVGVLAELDPVELPERFADDPQFILLLQAARRSLGEPLTPKKI